MPKRGSSCTIGRYFCLPYLTSSASFFINSGIPGIGLPSDVNFLGGGVLGFLLVFTGEVCKLAMDMKCKKIYIRTDARTKMIII